MASIESYGPDSARPAAAGGPGRTGAARPSAARGLVVAAPASGSGKTTVTLALLRHLRERGVRAASVKVGPDYIDPAFHAAASGRACINVDPWAMRGSTFRSAVAAASRDADLVVAEGVMGLFDGATADAGSTADVAAAVGWPIVLVVDASAMAASAAAVVQGFAGFRSDVDVAGVIYNRVGSDRHRELLVEATSRIGVPVLGCLRRDASLALPDRHLGLVQASEHPDLERFLATAAAAIGAAVDIDPLLRLARPATLGVPGRAPGPERVPAPSGPGASGDLDPSAPLPAFGQRIAVARDEAFGFVYPHLLDGWREAGAEISTFSPLADEPPAADADAIYLPGGYPELHAGRIAAARRFIAGLRAAARRGATVYGECGGYMVLGESLVDARGEAHSMAGLLPIATTFAEPRLTLGYRTAHQLAESPLGPARAGFRGHEFHYARVLREDGEEALFFCADARGRDLGPAGRRVGTVMGSFVHLVDRAGDEHPATRARAPTKPPTPPLRPAPTQPTERQQ